ncbi:MAG: hypothetical protein IPK15_14090 [Verrucomicrobia bacterium]|nr:hypothetical protein [Verrucomicrobiota bacterium]
MEKIIPAEAYFSSLQPAALHLPHLITAIDADLLGKIVHMTKSKPGLWGVAAPFDENDVFDRARESAPFSAWALPANQAELLSFGLLAQEAVFGIKLMMLDASFDEPALVKLATTSGERLETGAYITHGYQDLPTLAELVERCEWALIPIGAERSKALFITNQEKGDWVATLKAWCDRNGRNCGTVRTDGGQLVIAETSAPEKYRENAIAHRIDRLLGEMDCYFGGVGADALTIIQKRIEHREKLQQDIARSKRGGAGA